MSETLTVALSKKAASSVWDTWPRRAPLTMGTRVRMAAELSRLRFKLARSLPRVRVSAPSRKRAVETETMTSVSHMS